MDRAERISDPLLPFVFAQETLQARMWTAMPGIVQSYNAVAMTCVVQPAIKAVQQLEDGSSIFVTLPLLLDCPVVFPNGGGFTLTFPIATGDEVLVVFGARCIDSWWQSGGIQVPLEARMNDLSDGFVIPGPFSQPRKLAAVSTTTTQLRTNGGDTYLELTPNNINIIAASTVNVTAPVVNIEGVTGDIAIGGVSLLTHTHNSVESGPDNSGPPNVVP